MTALTQLTIGILATVSLAVSGYFATNQTLAANKIENLSAMQASTAQKTIDIDARLTRIEDKLDKVISTR